DRGRGGEHQLNGVLHRLRGVVEEDVHRARADVDRQDAIVGHEAMLASRRNASARRTLLPTVNPRDRALPSIVAVVVLGIAFGALLLDSARTPSELAPASSPPGL